MEPEPAADGVEWIARGIARAGLDLGILVGDQIAAFQLAGLQPVVEREQVQRQGQQDQQPAGVPAEPAFLAGVGVLVVLHGCPPLATAYGISDPPL